MQFDKAKLKAVILYTCQKCDPGRLGAVKLHKVLYYADMLQYANSGSPITGATYRKRALGPTCDQLLPTLLDLVKDHVLTVRTVDYFGFQKKEYETNQEPDLSRLSRQELNLVDEVIDFVCNANSARTISEYSHNKAWEMAEFGDVIPYNSVYHIFPNQVSPEAMEWAGDQVARIGAQRQNENPLDRPLFSDLRKRFLSAVH